MYVRVFVFGMHLSVAPLISIHYVLCTYQTLCSHHVVIQHSASCKMTYANIKTHQFQLHTLKYRIQNTKTEHCRTKNSLNGDNRAQNGLKIRSKSSNHRILIATHTEQMVFHMVLALSMNST